MRDDDVRHTPTRPAGAAGQGSRWVSISTAVLVVLLFVAAARDDRPAFLEAKLGAAESALAARTGELTLVRLELARLQAVHRQSERHGIPADLAAAIHDIAVVEGIDPWLAFSLVRVESRFTAGAISSAGAVGLTQVMPSTAFWLDPRLDARDLFDERTNLRLGFRYLRTMIRQYDGDLRLALLAYNRGPGRVDEIRRFGGDPANGYARRVMRDHGE